MSQLPFFRIDRATGGLPFFNTLLRLRLRGSVDPVLVVSAVGDVVRRQAVLRTVHTDGPDGAVQRVTHREPDVLELDLRGRPAGLEQFVRREGLTGFDLAAAPAVRWAFLRCADDEWCLVITMHHVVTDSSSQPVLIRDFATAYRRRVEGRAPLAETVARYVDFARWQRETLRGDRLTEHLEYVVDLFTRTTADARRRGSGPGPARTRPGGAAPFRTWIESVAMPAGTWRGMAALAAEHDVDVEAVVAAALMAFCLRWWPDQPVLLSTQNENRSWPGSEELVGCFANVVHVGAVTPPDADAAELLNLAEDAWKGAVEHAELPFDSAAALLEERGRSLRPDLPQLAYAIRRRVTNPMELPGAVLTVANARPPTQAIDPTTYPLVVELDPGAEAMVVHRLADHWTDPDYARARAGLLECLASFPADVERRR